MKRYLRLIIQTALVNSLLSCNKAEEFTAKNNPGETRISMDSLTISDGGKWLKRRIEFYFNSEKNFMKGFSSFCTMQYLEYKQDAANINHDGGMTEAEFKSKWAHRTTEHAGINQEFMVATIDFGKIEVDKCKFNTVSEMNNLLYDVLIIDKTFNSKFHRQVVLVKEAGSFLIDDVREISNEFQERK